MLYRAQKEKKLKDSQEKYEAEIADLNTQIDRLNEENELLTRTLCEQQEAYSAKKTSIDSLVETKEASSYENTSMEITENNQSTALLSREFEHHLILSAWSALRDEIVIRNTSSN